MVSRRERGSVAVTAALGVVAVVAAASLAAPQVVQAADGASAARAGGVGEEPLVRVAAGGHRATAEVDEVTTGALAAAGVASAVRPHRGELDRLVDRLAADVEHNVVHERLWWDGERVRYQPPRDGVRVRSAATRARVARAAANGGGSVDAVTERVPARGDPRADAVRGLGDGERHRWLARASTRVGEALDRPLELVAGDETLQVPVTEVGAQPRLSHAGDRDAPRALVRLDDAAVQQVVAAAEGAFSERRQDGEVRRDGPLRVQLPRDGRRVVDDVLADRVNEAVSQGSRRVEVPLETDRADVTDEFDDAMVVELESRRLRYFSQGQEKGVWDVAVGRAARPTPTGEFEVGEMRRYPTWVNPAPDGWGAGMPAVVGPGESNPLGVRAINWNRPGGGDTLIRVHGTPDVHTIGSAASNGCVRMRNSEVRELFDMVSQDTRVISVSQ